LGLSDKRQLCITSFVIVFLLLRVQLEKFLGDDLGISYVPLETIIRYLWLFAGSRLSIKHLFGVTCLALPSVLGGLALSELLFNDFKVFVLLDVTCDQESDEAPEGFLLLLVFDRVYLAEI
jgi:hypothetical protein